MNAQTVGWLVFLALIKNFSCQPPYFQLVDKQLTAKEGSCIAINCTVHRNLPYGGAYWFWMKDAVWNKGVSDFDATIIYSTDKSKRSVSPDFEGRVKYTGSLSWESHYTSPQPHCSILICNLNKTDSGNYSVRYVGQYPRDTWRTKSEVSLTVQENPCLITFEKPPIVNESVAIPLTCSTLSSCTSNPQIQGLAKGSQTQKKDKKQKSTTYTFTANWQDDGKEFSCQTEDNKDTNLIRNVSITVEYAPKGILAKMNPETVKKGQFVTLTCSANGRPEPTFTWFHNEQEHSSGAELKLERIEVSQSGEYRCEARNKHGWTSSAVNINVTYVPEVEVNTAASVLKEGDKMTLICEVKRSNPQPHTYTWLRDTTGIGSGQTYVVERIKPEDRGSYTCSAINTAGTGQSEPHQIEVQYSPRKASITSSERNNKAKAGNVLTFYCNTDANPAPQRYSWYRYSKYKQTDSSQWTSTTTVESLSLGHVQRADEACYTCNATNAINTGENSEPVCIEVLYPPTEPMLSMENEVREGQQISISCTVESSPPSRLTLTRTSASKPQSSERPFKESFSYPYNTLNHTFTVTSIHTGFYTCTATNSEGSNKSMQKKLLVKYRPKDVRVKAEPGLVVYENTTLTLRCIAPSHPPVTSVTWTTMIDGKSEIIWKTWDITIKSVSPSDSGLYSCAARNEIGAGESQRVEVKVKYAPKHMKISRAAEQHHTDGTSSVRLTCSSHSYPPVTGYSWHKKTKDGNVIVYNSQNYTVSSDNPGYYFCIAKNEIDQTSSDPVQLFVYRGLLKALKFIFLSLTILLIIFFIFLVYRHKRKKSIQQRRRNLMNEPVMAEPFRSRDDLLPDQPCRPKAHRRQPRPDSTPASNMNSVYCTVNLPGGQQPIRQQGGHAEADSLNYASLHFGDRQKNKQANAEEDVTYAMVSQQKPPKKVNQNEQEEPQDYENVGAAKSRKPLNYDTDTSEDEVDLNYTQVNFKAKPGHERPSTDSSSSDEEQTQYSEVKI